VSRVSVLLSSASIQAESILMDVGNLLDSVGRAASLEGEQVRMNEENNTQG
jgi:hypothetical protein